MESTSTQVKIIAGQWRGRKLSVVDQPGLRPTGNRIRETLFNWLQPVIKGSHCLDLFAGTGALGFEALSRGAASATMLEQSKVACSHLNTTKTQLKANATIIETSCLHWLKRTPAQAANIVFIDPPFDDNLWASAIEQLQQPGQLADEAWIYIESPKNRPLMLPAHWQNHRQKTAGSVSFCLLYAKQGSQAPPENS